MIRFWCHWTVDMIMMVVMMTHHPGHCLSGMVMMKKSWYYRTWWWCTHHPVHEQHDQDERENEGEKEAAVAQQTESLAFPAKCFPKYWFSLQRYIYHTTFCILFISIVESPAKAHRDVLVGFLLLEGHLLQGDLVFRIFRAWSRMYDMKDNLVISLLHIVRHSL